MRRFVIFEIVGDSFGSPVLIVAAIFAVPITIGLIAESLGFNFMTAATYTGGFIAFAGFAYLFIGVPIIFIHYLFTKFNKRK